MKCTNRKCICSLMTVCIISLAILSGCGSVKIDEPFSLDTSKNEFTISSGADTKATAELFATNLCVSENDYEQLTHVIDNSEAGGLFDVTEAQTVYAKNIHRQMNPASLTKIMTAYIALKYGHLEDTLTASTNVIITESGAQVLGLREGCKMTLEQALYSLMLYSANDSAVLIAEYLSGSVESFAAVMNDEAKKLGATNTHFVNPNGLTDEQHYTTVYDLYLIFNAAMQYDEFRKIINTAEYTVTYRNQNGDTVNKEISNTNGYLSGDFAAPSNVGIIGGKTGTTKAAGSCLALLSNSTSGHTYISIVLHSSVRQTLYEDMTSILSDIP